MIRAIWYLVVGFFAGLIARALLPGADSMGLVATSLVGIIGSLVGGLLGGIVRRPAPGVAFHPAGFFMSIVGAMVFLYLMRYVR